MLPDSSLGSDQDTFIVEWFVPGLSKAETFRQGRRKEVLDIFGTWRLFSDLSQRDASAYTLPVVVCNRADILITNVKLDGDGRIPFATFNDLRANHGIDVTALSVSQTHYSNLFRAYVLMSPPT